MSLKSLFQAMSGAVIDVQTVINKRKDHVYFYNDPHTDYEVDESKMY